MRIVTVEDRCTAEAPAFVSESTAAPSHVMTGVNKFEVGVVRCSKEPRSRCVFGLTVLIDLHLFADILDVLAAVQRIEDPVNQFLLVRVKC
jgi:hypothetical protein